MKSSTKIENVADGEYGCRDDCSVVRRYSVAAGRGERGAGERLRTIRGSIKEADKSECVAGQEDATRFYGFPLNF